MERHSEGEEGSLMELLDAEFLCFGADHGSCKKTASDSYSTSSSTSRKGTTESASNKKQRRGGAAASLGTIKVRKDKLGDKIAALQLLVSPFGKSDTASVLNEALGYIRFLHDQVQVLSSPYLLQRLPTAASLHRDEEGSCGDLRSRGLCLVPISCTEQVAGDAHQNGADLWSPAAGAASNFNCSKNY